MRNGLTRKAKVADIFSSIQGEGIYTGTPQLFVRFYDCKWNCRFCDTRLTTYEKYTPLQLFHQVKRFRQPYHSLCLTGGEPLLQKDFLKEFLRLVKYDGRTVYLETNGILADALAELIKDIDIIAMDLKLPSSTGMEKFWPEHHRFLKVALEKDVFVKIVVCANTQRQDLDQAIKLILRLKAKKIPVVLQPNFFELSRELFAKTRILQKYCAQRLDRVEVIPQMHRVTGMR